MEMHTADDLLQAYARGERKFSYWTLSGADLHGADLRDANFYGSDLSGANLSGTDFSRANLGKADLYNANLSGANLSGAFYQDANLTRADMSGIITNNPSPQESQPVVTPASQMPSQPTPAVLSSPPSIPQGGARIVAPAGQNNPPAPSVSPKVKSSSKPTRTDLQTLGVGVIFVLGGILLPSQTEQCSTTGFGQYCIETVYTYNGVSAPVCKGFLIVVGILCFVVAGVLYANRNTKQN